MHQETDRCRALCRGSPISGDALRAAGRKPQRTRAHRKRRQLTALEIPGVVAVLTANDLPIARDAAGHPMKTPIAIDEALYAGQIVAIVLAETESAAEDGAMAVVVNDAPLPVVNTL